MSGNDSHRRLASDTSFFREAFLKSAFDKPDVDDAIHRSKAREADVSVCG